MRNRLCDWKWTEGKEKCEWCEDHWEDLVDENDNVFAGTVIVPACGTGCCHIRENCTECNGTGIKS